jgi:hypothetical protein
MKANIVYSDPFRIPKLLPHRSPSDGDGEIRQDDIFNDSVGVEEGKLILRSCCGKTTFHDWIEDEVCFFVAIFATYDGARRAFNAVWGIEFPECVVTGIESTLGKFLTLEDYDYARVTSMSVMKNVERFLKATHSTNPRAEAQARMWLMQLEDALRPVIDMDDPCRNPIHPDGSKGYLA